MIRQKLEEHRRMWAKKPLLRREYRGYFRLVLRHCSPLRPIVELGCGAGMFKESCPEAIATDLEETPWTDRTADCCDLPFGDGSVGNLVMVDVFHHLARPGHFLEQAARVLKDGGRVIMVEPWTSPLGYWLYSHAGDERPDYSVDPERPFPNSKNAFEGNPALPRMFFSSRRPLASGRWPEQRLHIVALEELPAAGLVLSCGFRSFSLLPSWLWPVADGIDLLARPFVRLAALRAVITLERRNAINDRLAQGSASTAEIVA